MGRNASLVLLAVLFGAGCGGGLPGTVPELRDACVAARDEAQAARADGDVERAESAAERARAALAKVERLAYESEAAAADAARGEAALACREAVRIADLTGEEVERAEALRSWKAESYRAARRSAWKAMCTVLATAADGAAAAEVDGGTVSRGAQQSAAIAAELAAQAGIAAPVGVAAPANGDSPDWTAVATDVRAMTETTPVDVSVLLAATLLAAGQEDLAQVELDMIDPARLDTDARRDHFHLVRGLVYVGQGWNQLAIAEVEQIPTVAAGEGGAFLAGVHLVMAFLHVSDGDMERADAALVEAMRLWPDNPVATFVTGQRLAADGRHEEAGDTLEKLAENTEYEVLASMLSRRARAIRDGQIGDDLLAYEPEFMRALAVEHLRAAAAESAAARELQRSLDASKALLRRLLQGIPLVPPDDDPGAGPARE